MGIALPPGPMLPLRGAGLGAPPGADMIVESNCQEDLSIQVGRKEEVSVEERNKKSGRNVVLGYYRACYQLRRSTSADLTPST